MPRTALFLQRWAFTSYGSHVGSTVSSTEASQIARDYDVISANSGVFTPWVSEMKQVNPSLVILQYENATFSLPSQSFPETYYLHDSTGARVHSVVGPGLGNGNYLMNPSSSDWLQSVGQACATDRTSSQYDGCYFGMLSTAMFAKNYLASQPINPATGNPWTTSEWVNALTAAVPVLRSANTVNNVSVPIVGNTVIGGGVYFAANGASPRPVLDELDGGQAEAFLHGGQQAATVYPSLKTWRENVQMLVDAGSRGDVILTTTKVWHVTDQSVLDSWHAYSLATFLLGSNGQSYYEFSPAPTLQGMSPDSPWDAVDVGQPTTTCANLTSLGGCQRAGGYYERDFTNGFVVVNPTTVATTVPLAACYTDLSGQTHTGSYALGPNSGNVLLQNC